MAGGYALHEARRPPVVVRYDLPSRAGACPCRPLRVAVLGDLHVSATTPPATVAAIVAAVNRLRPDYVLLVGDFLGHGWPADAAGVHAALAPLAGLRPRVGTAAVLGNNDVENGIDLITAGLRAAGIRVLWNDAWITPEATVFGVADLTTDDANPQQAIDRYHADLRHQAQSPSSLSFWLAHQPVMFDRVQTTGTMLFTGHTHGGQVLPTITIPLAHATLRVVRAMGLAGSWPAERYVRGLYRKNGRQMIVTSGIGVSGLPLRLGVPPEIVLARVAACPASP